MLVQDKGTGRECWEAGHTSVVLLNTCFGIGPRSDRSTALELGRVDRTQVVHMFHVACGLMVSDIVPSSTVCQ